MRLYSDTRLTNSDNYLTPCLCILTPCLCILTPCLCILTFMSRQEIFSTRNFLFNIFSFECYKNIQLQNFEEKIMQTLIFNSGVGSYEGISCKIGVVIAIGVSGAHFNSSILDCSLKWFLCGSFFIRFSLSIQNMEK